MMQINLYGFENGRQEITTYLLTRYIKESDKHVCLGIFESYEDAKSKQKLRSKWNPNNDYRILKRNQVSTISEIKQEE